MTFRKQLLAERDRLNLTQTQAAKALGISLRTVAAWETTDTPPPLTQIGALAVLRALPTPGDTVATPGEDSPVKAKETLAQP